MQNHGTMFSAVLFPATYQQPSDGLLWDDVDVADESGEIFRVRATEIRIRE